MDLGVYTRHWEVEDRSWLGSRDGTQYTQSITLDVSLFVPGEHYPNGYIKSGTLLGKVTASGLYGPYGGNTTAVQTVTVTGNPTGGTFTLTLGAQTTAPIAYNASPATVQTALQALSTIGAGNAVVSGGPGPVGPYPIGPSDGPGIPYVVTFEGTMAGAAVATMTASGTGLTGGTSPGVTVAATVTGGVAVTDGRGTAAGFLFNTTQVGHPGFAKMPPRLGAPLLWRGVVKTSRLPATSGLDAAAQTALAGRFLFKAN